MLNNYQKLNNLTGWLIFLISTAVYVLTVEPTASFWDAGEFIACAYKLQVPHPPGAPLFLLIGRIFALFTSDVTKVAVLVNMVSVVSSGFTVLFLFWTITLLTKKLAVDYNNPTTGETIAIIGSGIIGSLAFTFSDSFWFSAVEAEVYAMSSFFTAFVFWAILKWETKAEEPDSDKWLVLIAYMMGLSIGVHLLNLVTVPALGLVYYFKKYKPTRNGLILTIVISCIIIVVILVGVIPGLPSIAGQFEIFFVNSLGLPFNTGIIVFTLLFLGAIIYGIHYSIKEQKKMLNTILLSLVFILIGYASYGIIVIRSNYNPPIDENNPENVISFVSYLKREQYGDRPLLRGPLFTAGYPIDAEKGAPLYRKDSEKGEYVVYDYKMKYEYDPKHITLFPRAYSTQGHHVEAYGQWMKLRPGRKPTFWQDKSFMLNYQIGFMYLRYFGWNFVGRQSDIQDAGVLWPTQSAKGMPEILKNNKGRNNFFALPLILGIVGMIFHFIRKEKDAWVVMTLFIMTGLAIVVYLNQPPVEPRERDYTFAGSFYAFCIWIGMGVFFLSDLLKKYLSSEVLRPTLVTLICLIVPGIMAAQGWDDHDRSNRYHAVDSAKNLLNSCAPNAIIFTGGDNDTFPLWYVQEVEGFRTDVRVCNLSLLNTDWYIDQMKRQAYDSEPLPISLEFDDYIQGKNDQVYFVERPKYSTGINLAGYLQLVKSENPEVRQESGRSGDFYTIFPSKNFFLDIDKEAVIGSGAVPDTLHGLILDRLSWNINASTLEKKDLVILDMIVTNNWKRPIYFSTTLSGANFLNLKEYTQLEGLAHRLLPVKYPAGSQGFVNSTVMYDRMMNNFHWRELDNPKVYYDENYLRFPVNARSQFYRLAAQLYAEGKKEKSLEVIRHCYTVMPDATIPYDLATPPFINLLFKLDQDEWALEIANTMATRSLELVEFYRKNKYPAGRDYDVNFYILDHIIRALKEAGKTQEAAKYEEQLMKFSSFFRQ
ncbi:MAG: DUF2723 domain-containing protein [Cytophagaceae bacterium]